ncbi:hypothetical protein GCM10017667_51480 [Streptomyces filamentosus]|uniref:Uncharacterized protein n=1 Tax=Streptomyces filamentosus TaxID=67294 RepID=A0A919BS32_STRFL|nr:hypothetical protein GCM10017667_51480 [Streptomyces filamentosus]
MALRVPLLRISRLGLSRLLGPSALLGRARRHGRMLPRHGRLLVRVRLLVPRLLVRVLVLVLRVLLAPGRLLSWPHGP